MQCLSSFTENTNGTPPNGFKVITSGRRAIILLHYDDQMRTLKFEDITAAIKDNLPAQKTYDYSLPDPPAAIRSIVCSSANTFGLLADGRIFYCISYRAVEVIPNVRGVRAICDSDQGFALIRNSSPTEVFIEFYTDRSASEMLKKYKKISIGWEEEWAFDRDEEQSVLQLVRLESDAIVALFSHFVDEAEDEEAAAAHGGYSKAAVFSVNCSLFCIFYENARDVQTGVNTIRTYLSNVQSIEVFSSGIMCVLLASGVIQLLYVVGEEGALQEDSIFLGLEGIQTVASVAAENCLYISDRNQCVKVMLRLGGVSGSRVEWTVERIDLMGVVGISYLEEIKVVLLLTENCFIYAVEHTTQTHKCDNHLENVEGLQDSLVALAETHQDLRQEISKSTAINVMLNPQVVADNCQAILSFKSYVDYYDLPTVVDRNANQLYDINLEFQFQPELERIFESGKWTMNVNVMGRGDACRREAIELDKEFLKRRRIKLLRGGGGSRDMSTIAADYSISIQGFISSAEKLLIDVPIKVAYNIGSIVEVLEEDPMEMTGRWKFTIKSKDRTILSRLLDLVIKQRMHLEPFVLGIGQSAIVVNLDESSCTFRSDDQTALDLLKKMMLLEGHSRGIWTQISYEPKETIALCGLTARHALFDDGAVEEAVKEVYRDIRDCIINLS